MSSVAISVDHVWKNFRLYHERNRYIKAAVLRGRRARYEEFWALTDVSFEINHGSTFGIIGSNGSGKSTLLKCLAGILYPNKGKVVVNGRTAALLELGAGFHYELTGRENIFLNGAILGLNRKELQRRFDEIVEFSGLERFIDTPVKNYSNGMIVRLGFSVAANIEPEILLIDEVLSVGDQNFQRRSADKIEDFRREGRTIVVVSHGMSQVQQLCRDAVWLEKGEVKAIGAAIDVIETYSPSAQSQSEVGAESAPHSSHVGGGQVTLSEVILESLDGQVCEFVRSGQGLCVRAVIDARVPVADLMVKVTMSSKSGLELWSTSTKTSGVALPVMHGRSALSLEITSLPLIDGDYCFSLSLHDVRGKLTFDTWTNAVSFEVRRYGRFDDGLLAINAKWKV